MFAEAPPNYALTFINGWPFCPSEPPLAWLNNSALNKSSVPSTQNIAQLPKKKSLPYIFATFMMKLATPRSTTKHRDVMQRVDAR
jgi:hypothetical protein